MRALLLRALILGLVLLTVSFALVLAQDATPLPGTEAWEGVSNWRLMELAPLSRSEWCAGLNVESADYEAAVAAQETEADTLEVWCLEIKARFYSAALMECQDCLSQAQGTAMVSEPQSLVCDCVCAQSSEEACQRCQDNPSDPELLQLPGICECIVRQ